VNATTLTGTNTTTTAKGGKKANKIGEKYGKKARVPRRERRRVQSPMVLQRPSMNWSGHHGTGVATNGTGAALNLNGSPQFTGASTGCN